MQQVTLKAPVEQIDVLPRLAVVGCGRRATEHVEALRMAWWAASILGVDRSEERAHRFQRQLASVPSVARLEDALPDVDAVIVACPVPAVRHTVASLALDHGRHVLVEAPPAEAVTDVLDLVARARSTSAILAMIPEGAHDPGVARLRRLQRTGVLGAVRHLRLELVTSAPREGRLDVVWDLGPESLAILNHLAAAPPAGISGWVRRRLHERLDDTATLLLDYPAGVTAEAHLSWLGPRQVRRIIATGTARSAVHEQTGSAATLRVYEGVHEVTCDPVPVVPRAQTLVPIHQRFAHRIRSTDPTDPDPSGMVDLVACLMRADGLRARREKPLPAPVQQPASVGG